MTKNIDIKLLSAAFVAACAASLFSMGTAQASMPQALQNCKTNSKSATFHCCETSVRGNMPFWMRDTGRNCATQVKCYKKYCYVKMEFASQNQGNGDKYRDLGSRSRQK